MRFLYKNETYTLEALNRQTGYRRLRNPILATGPDLPLEDLVYVFGNERDFYGWTARLRLADKFAAMRQKIKEAQQFERRDHAHIIRRQMAQSERIAVELQELANRTGLALNSKELFLKATDKSNILEGAIFDPVILWTGVNYSGNFLALNGPIVDLRGVPGFNDNVESVLLSGICTLCADPWFRGARLMLFGAVAGYTNLGELAWNNRASSVFVF